MEISGTVYKHLLELLGITFQQGGGTSRAQPGPFPLLPSYSCIPRSAGRCKQGEVFPEHPDQASLDLHRTLPFCPLSAARVLPAQALGPTVPLTGSIDEFCMSLEASHPQDDSSWSQVFYFMESGF